MIAPQMPGRLLVLVVGGWRPPVAKLVSSANGDRRMTTDDLCLRLVIAKAEVEATDRVVRNLRDLTLQAPGAPQLVALSAADRHAEQRGSERLLVETAGLARVWRSLRGCIVRKSLRRPFSTMA